MIQEGDEVIVLDGSKAKYYFGSWIDDMDQYVGEKLRVLALIEGRDGAIRGARLEGSAYTYDIEYLTKFSQKGFWDDYL